MPKFSKISKQRLDSCHKDLQELFNRVVCGFDCTVIEGHRSVETQKEYYRKGVTQTMKSKHLEVPAQAIDVVPYPTGYDDRDTMIHFAGYVKGIADSLGIRITWGGDWNKNNIIEDKEWFDGAHFQLDL